MKTILETKTDKDILWHVSDAEYLVITETINSWKMNGFGLPHVDNVLGYIRKTLPAFGRNITRTETRIDKRIENIKK